MKKTFSMVYHMGWAEWDVFVERGALDGHGNVKSTKDSTFNSSLMNWL